MVPLVDVEALVPAPTAVPDLQQRAVGVVDVRDVEAAPALQIDELNPLPAATRLDRDGGPVLVGRAVALPLLHTDTVARRHIGRHVEALAGVPVDQLVSRDGPGTCPCAPWSSTAAGSRSAVTAGPAPRPTGSRPSRRAPRGRRSRSVSARSPRW